MPEMPALTFIWQGVHIQGPVVWRLWLVYLHRLQLSLDLVIILKVG